MKRSYINIDYTHLAKAFSKYVKLKASHSNSTIVYLENGSIIEEDPRTKKRIVLKQPTSK